MSRPVVSIVVPSYRRPTLLASCLDSVRETVDVDHEVICVVVAGDNESRDVVASREDVRLIEEPQRGGMVRALNRGYRAARGEYLTAINDDCELLPFSISNAVRFLKAPAHADVGQAAFFHDSPVLRNVYAHIDVENIRYVVCHVRGLCYANFGMARRTLFERLEYMDERYFMYGADPDFSLKVWHEARLRVLPCPGSLVHHLEMEDDRARIERPGQADDNRLLFEKWMEGGHRGS